MRIRTILIIALITLVLALAAGCTGTTTSPADPAKAQPATTAAPVVQTTEAAIVPSVQTASISGAGIVGCVPGFTPCGDACVNLKTNGTNCGSCGNTCPVNQPVCKEGQCSSA